MQTRARPGEWNSVSAIEDICRPCWGLTGDRIAVCRPRNARPAVFSGGGDYGAIKAAGTRESIAGKNTGLMQTAGLSAGKKFDFPRAAAARFPAAPVILLAKTRDEISRNFAGFLSA